ncbi:nitric oxide reductase activation protein [Mycolicibacter heraklionensis]|uniref:Nitric oxide reductase activation protein n=1 Tax=Mycolicibacter heraklionensis TaxID=512402 RepID=A0ABR5FK56_9MYCO|nr:VWA domain-containing protein [Mycolicibacter heraklionensis]KLO31403.1 nitric oxide reductase activation protein [Mycolicibacter heraklionensis]
MTNHHEAAESVQRWNLLASALSGRALQVAAAGVGELAWTDGKTVFVDPAAGAAGQLEAVTVQACLLAAGSLEPELVRRLVRRPALTARYLAVEGHRALAAGVELLPPAVASLIDHELAARSESPAESLTLANAVDATAPPAFGVIRPGKLLAEHKNGAKPLAQDAQRPRRQSGPLADLDEGDAAEDAVDIFSSPVGGSGALGRLVAKMLEVTRRLRGNGPPGADAPTHRTRSGVRGFGNAVSSAGVGAVEDDNVARDPVGATYHEWDVHRRCYRPNWCTVVEVVPSPDTKTVLRPADYGLRRPLARLGVGLDRYHRQPQGDDIDLDAAIEGRVEALAGSAPDEAVYLDSLRRRRDLAVLILLDVSASAAEPGTLGETVHEQQRAAAAALATALHDLGDRLALYAFHSQGRSAVHVSPVKRFDEALDVLAMRRLQGLKPGAYSRLGAAIRHGSTVLERRGGTPRRLLVVLSDGLAYDHGYERRYGAADARRALAEARRRGTGCLCLTVGAATDVEELRRVFGSAAHATIPRLDQLNRVIGPLFRSALCSADLRRRVA